MSSRSGSDSTPTEAPSGLARLLPILFWLPRYDRSWLPGDIVAGISTWALTVPTAMAFSSVMGTPVEYGLYAGAAGSLTFALFTTSRHVVIGYGASPIALIGSVLAVALGSDAAGTEDAIAFTAAVAFVAGLLYTGFYILRMGWISRFLSHSVITGLTFGVGVDIAVGQLPKVTATEGGGENTWMKFGSWLDGLSAVNWWSASVGVGAVLVIVGVKRFLPRLPATLVAVALAIVAAWALNLDERGVVLVGEVPQGLPSLVLPSLELIRDNWETIGPTAFAVVLIGFSMTTAGVRKYAREYDYNVDMNQELLGQGAPCVASSLVQGSFMMTSLSRSPVNVEAGASTQVSNLTQGTLFALTVVVLAPVFELLPEAVLGAILIYIMITGLVDVPELVRIYRLNRIECATAVLTLLTVFSLGTLEGVVVGVGLSLLWLIAVASQPAIPELGRKPGTDTFYSIAEHPQSESYDHLCILRFDGGLFFVSAEQLGNMTAEVAVSRRDSLEAFIINMEGVNFIDIAGADQLREIVDHAHADGHEVRLARVPTSALSLLERAGVIDLIGSDHVHDSVDEAVEAQPQRESKPSPPTTAGATPASRSTRLEGLKEI